MTKSEKNNLMKGLLFISPWILGFSIMILYPFVTSLYYSFCSYSIFEKPLFIGLENYKDLYNDTLFWKSLYNTFYFAVFAIPLGIVSALGLAILLNNKIKGQTIYRLIFYIPTLVPIVAMAILWMWIFNGEFGVLNQFLLFFGIKGPSWLQDTTWAMPALIFMGLWAIGGSVIIYLAGLQDVPESLLESAELDGANTFQKIRHVVIPMISPIIYFNLIMGLIGALQVFAQAYIMTGGGPERTTTFYVYYLYQLAFEDFKMGYASAMAWILFVIILVLTIFAHNMSKKHVFYRGA